MATENDQPQPQDQIRNAVQLAGEYVLPGASNLMNGDLKTGGIHLLLGLAAGALLGPIGMLAVKANSYSRATTGRNVYEHFTSATAK
jgi:Family of unknown function (DUF6072)